jgi:DNA-binding PadR family transcriptional regulator
MCPKSMSHRYLILGLLMAQPLTGYDIKKHVQTALGTVTNASYGTLYPTLHRLLDEGAVEMQEVPQHSRPSKKVYQITDKGRQDLLAWLREPPLDDRVRREFLLKLYLADYLPTNELQLLLAARRGQAERTLQALREQCAAVENRRQVWLIKYELALCQAEIDWLNQVEREVREAS